jgi:hypothetical protein
LCALSGGGNGVDSRDEIIEQLKRIEQNQLKALEAQEKHLALAQAQLERSNQSIREGLELQRVAVARQTQVRNIALPLIVVLMLLIAYLLIKWRMI